MNCFFIYKSQNLPHPKWITYYTLQYMEGGLGLLCFNTTVIVCSWIYNYICNQCLSPLMWARIPPRRGVLDTTIFDDSDLRQVSGFLWVLYHCSICFDDKSQACSLNTFKIDFVPGFRCKNGWFVVHAA
jgi:hypothetical protein